MGLFSKGLIRKKFLIWLMKTRFYKWLLLSIIPFVRFTTYYTSLRGDKYHMAYMMLRPGDIVLAVDKRKATSLLIPGVMTHASLCVARFGTLSYMLGFEMAEMTHHNFTKSHFFDICKEADRVVILRCFDFDDYYIERMIQKCMSFEAAHYDVAFSLGVDALYCSELVYQSDFERRLKVDLSDLAGLGRPYISPDGLAMAKNVTCIHDTDGLWDGLTGQEIERRICNV